MILKIVTCIIAVVIIILIITTAENIKKINKNKMSFKEALDLAEIPIVTFTNNNMKLNFLLDTGSCQSLINKSMLSLVKAEKLNTVMYIASADGTKIPSNFCRMKIGYKNQVFENDFAIRDLNEAFKILKQESGVQVHGIIGSDFFQKYKYILDFKELIAYPQ